MLDEEDQLVELVSHYIAQYREVASSSQECVIEKLEDTITKECSKEDNREKVHYLIKPTVVKLLEMVTVCIPAVTNNCTRV